MQWTPWVQFFYESLFTVQVLKVRPKKIQDSGEEGLKNKILRHSRKPPPYRHLCQTTRTTFEIVNSCERSILSYQRPLRRPSTMQQKTPTETCRSTAAVEITRLDITAALDGEVMVAESVVALMCVDVVELGSVEAIKATMPWVTELSGKLLPFSSAQVEGSRPSGQQSPLTRQKEPLGHVSRGCEHNSLYQIQQEAREKAVG
jgi:hypothetical protein